MKKILSLLLISICLFGCVQEERLIPVRDDFGLDSTEFNTVVRILPFEEIETRAKRKPKPPPPPPITTPAVVLLDFDGYTVSNTSWNYNGDIICAESGLTLSEQQYILDTVASKYKQFGVQVTTDESIYNAAPIARRMRCIITITSDWFGMSGGTSFINSFTWGNNTPCFVFSLLLNYNIKRIACASAHEVGHTLGLLHQSSYDANCIKLSEYNRGTPQFAPIMGVAYYSDSCGWIRGSNPYGCNNIQDDTLIIKTTLGLK